MRILNRTSSEDADISMSPLIDCVFLLLIFFLVATMLREHKRDIAIELPESAAAVKLRPEPAQIVVGIDADGRFFFEGEPSTVTSLLHNLREVAASTPEQRIRLDIDRDAPVHAVIEVLHACQFRGLSNIGIRTYDRYYNR
jgi:biopolymer transport protein ExbD